MKCQDTRDNTVVDVTDTKFLVNILRDEKYMWNYWLVYQNYTEASLHLVKEYY